MRTPDIEGVAIHGGPELCVGDPRGRSEALTGVRAGQPLSREIRLVRGADAVPQAEGHIVGGASASRRRTPRGRRTCACTESSCARTGSSHCSPVRAITGRAAQGTLRRQA